MGEKAEMNEIKSAWLFQVISGIVNTTAIPFVHFPEKTYHCLITTSGNKSNSKITGVIQNLERYFCSLASGKDEHFWTEYKITARRAKRGKTT